MFCPNESNMRFVNSPQILFQKMSSKKHVTFIRTKTFWKKWPKYLKKTKKSARHESTNFVYKPLSIKLRGV